MSTVVTELITQAWAEELARRTKADADGTETAIPWVQAHKELRESTH